jgi:hypothetical protein
MHYKPLNRELAIEMAADFLLLKRRLMLPDYQIEKMIAWAEKPILGGILGVRLLMMNKYMYHYVPFLYHHSVPDTESRRKGLWFPTFVRMVMGRGNPGERVNGFRFSSEWSWGKGMVYRRRNGKLEWEGGMVS